MFRHITTGASIFALTLSMAAGPAMAASWENADANSDKAVSMQEYKMQAENESYFTRCDLNESGAIEETEKRECLDNDPAFNERFGSEAFNNWDTNQDNVIDLNEFSEGSYQSYDTNESGAIEGSELNQYGTDIGGGTPGQG